MEKDKILVVALVALSVLLVVTTLIIRLSEPVFEVPAIPSGFEMDGMVLPAKAMPTIRQMSLEDEPEEMTEDELEEVPEDDPELAPPDIVQDEPQVMEPDQEQPQRETFMEADTDEMAGLSEIELLAGIKNSVDGILLCIMLLMSTGIVALIIRIVYPLFRG